VNYARRQQYRRLSLGERNVVMETAAAERQAMVDLACGGRHE
jgi:hypothetical protein